VVQRGERYRHLVSRLRLRLGLRMHRSVWVDETEDDAVRVLHKCPAGTAVVYVYITPRIDNTLPIRRFRLVDMSIEDAVRAAAFGHGQLSETEWRAKLKAHREYSQRMDGIVTLSTYLADRISDELAIPRDRVTPIGLGPGLDELSPPDTRPERYRNARILFVGRDWNRKGGHLLLEAFRIVRTAIPHAELVIVGPPERPTAEHGVRYVPPINKATRRGARRLAQLYQEASVFCMPSVAEPWGMVYVEAAASGLPIIGIRQWAMPDIVKDGITGILLDERQPLALASALVSLLQDPVQMSSMGRTAYARFVDVLDWPHVVARLVHAVLPEQSSPFVQM